MNLKIEFMGVIADIAGVRKVDVACGDGQAPTLREVLENLEQRFGTEFSSRIFRSSSAPRRLQMATRIFVNLNLVNDRALDVPLSTLPDAASSPEILLYFLPAACGG